MPRRHLPRVLLAAALLAGGPARADSLRCDGGIVSTGDSKLDLLGKCGRPALREDEAEERSRSRLDDLTRSSRTTVTTVERWTYNFGPRQFIQVVTLEGGTVRAVERGSYGYDLGPVRDPVPLPRARCDQLALHVGDTAFEVLARCGEPAARDQKIVSVTQGVGSRGAVETRTATVDIWTYDFGPSVLVRRLTLADGRVVKVETGSYGYSR